jgi:hypothetical protein
VCDANKHFESFDDEQNSPPLRENKQQRRGAARPSRLISASSFPSINCQQEQRAKSKEKRL